MMKRLIIVFMLIMSATATTVGPKVQNITADLPVNLDLPYIN